MRIHTDFASLRSLRHPVVTIGTFDGVHLGHRAILSRLAEIARREGGETVLLTFYPHPRMVLHPQDHDLKLLNTPDEKSALLEEAGIEHLVVYPFSPEFSRLSAFDYVRDLLVSGIGARTVVIGYDHRFGRNREGDFGTLRELSEIFGFRVEEIPAREIDEVYVSSTKIRQALQQGEVERAASLLGYAYSLAGTVVQGDGRGRTIGVPTANLHVNYPYKLIPARGVYAGRVTWNQQEWPAVLNIGVRPTVHDQGAEVIEVHLLGFDQTIYGENLRVDVVRRIREERKFGSVSELTEQIRADIAQAESWL